MPKTVNTALISLVVIGPLCVSITTWASIPASRELRSDAVPISSESTPIAVSMYKLLAGLDHFSFNSLSSSADYPSL